MTRDNVDPRLQKFREARKAKKEAAVLEKKLQELAPLHVPGAQDTFLETRGYSVSKETLETNVLAWREMMGLEPNSVYNDFRNTLMEVRKDFPACEDPNQALQLRRWQRQQDRRAAQREASAS